MFSDYKPAATSVEILIAARKRGDGIFLATMTRILEQLSSPTVRVASVCSWFESVQAGSHEHLDICAIVVVSEHFLRQKTEEVLVETFRLVLPMLVGKVLSASTERVLFVHAREKSIIRTIGEMWNLETEQMMVSAHQEGWAHFSFAGDFIRARQHRAKYVARTEELVAKELHEQNAALTAPQDEEVVAVPSVVKTSWLAMIVETDLDTAEAMRTFLINKARRQNIDLRVDIRHSVRDATLGLSRLPFVVSTRSHLSGGWDGLEILAAAHRLNVPVVLRSVYGPKQIQGALNQRRIETKPKRVVHVDHLIPWADNMLSCLMSQTKH